VKYRKLRIAWSMTWGVLAVYLVVLTADAMKLRPLPKNVPSIMFGEPPLDVWITYDQGLLDVSSQSVVPGGSLCWGFELPLWQAILPAAAIAFAPWLPRRFSLCTLLIATTLIAVGLGIVIAALGR